ncbi:MAG: hypothetical protein KJ051_04685 [Thermoleophilia bacterium]|nr:hypothetical protein [Thermoleophilia bacterium]
MNETRSFLVPLDVYVEAPAGMGGFIRRMGGFIRLYEVAEIIRVAAGLAVPVPAGSLAPR